MLRTVSAATAAPDHEARALASQAGSTQSAPPDSVIEVEGMDFFYSDSQALFDINLAIPARQVTAFIGPSGCGKSTLLRCFNRMNDRVPGAGVRSGTIRVLGQDIHAPSVDPVDLRRRVGMVFQKSNPFPKSIFDNVAYGLHLMGTTDPGEVEETVERSLRGAALWDEVKDRLDQNAFGLSGGQQQRLCIARSIAAEPEVILMDEPCSALDPIATAKIEELIGELHQKYTIVIVTHNMQQAMRTAQKTAFFYLGKLIEYGPTMKLFQNPDQELTEQYVTGRFG